MTKTIIMRMATVIFLIGISVTVVLSDYEAWANTVFDSGSPDLVGLYDAASFVVAADFVLDENTVLTDVHFWTAENHSWDGTLEYFIFADDGGTPANIPLASGIGTDIVKNPTGNILLDFADEFEYSFNLETPISLDGGVKYWLGLHLKEDFISVAIGWETGTGFGDNVYLSNGGTFDNWFESTSDVAFSLTDDLGTATIPQWIKDTIEWWAAGTVSDQEFLDAMEFLINQGIIQVNCDDICLP